MTASQTRFSETLLARVAPWLILSGVCVIALFVPIVQSQRAIEGGVLAFLVITLICFVRAIVVHRTVISFDETAMTIVGVRPGIWKLFQRWVVKRIEDTNITQIRIGYLREEKLGGLITLPPGEPSKGAKFQLFLWVRYECDGHACGIYYPHLKNVKDFKRLIEYLETRYTSKVEKIL